MVNNFELIKSLLSFNSEDEFYFAQIIKRKKEHPELGSNNYCVKTYYIKSIEHLEKVQDEMIAIANHHNARVCINLNKRSFEKMSFQLMRKVADIIMNKDYKSCRQAFDSVCGAYSHDEQKKWIIDVDRKDDFLHGNWLKEKLFDVQPVGEKVLAVIPTKNGYHLISKPFNMQEAKDFLHDDVHKDNPTILYIPPPNNYN